MSNEKSKIIEVIKDEEITEIADDESCLPIESEIRAKPVIRVSRELAIQIMVASEDPTGQLVSLLKPFTLDEVKAFVKKYEAVIGCIHVYLETERRGNGYETKTD